MAENQAKISLIFEIKQLDEEKEHFRLCEQCKKLNLKKAIIIKDAKIDLLKKKSDYMSLALSSSHLQRLTIVKNVFRDISNKNIKNHFKINYFCSKGCAKLYFEIKSKTTVDKWLKY